MITTLLAQFALGALIGSGLYWLGTCDWRSRVLTVLGKAAGVLIWCMSLGLLVRALWVLAVGQ